MKANKMIKITQIMKDGTEDPALVNPAYVQVVETQTTRCGNVCCVYMREGRYIFVKESLEELAKMMSGK